MDPMNQESNFDIDPSFSGDDVIGGAKVESQDVKDARAIGQEVQPDPVSGSNFGDLIKDRLQDLMKYELEYPAAGKQVKEPLEMILKRASQGYDYAQKMGDINTLQKTNTDLQEKIKTLEYLKEIDDYYRSNPEWAEHIKSGWEKRAAIQNKVDPNDPMFNFFDSKLRQVTEAFDTINTKLSSLEQEKLQQQMQAEDSALEAEIQDIRKEHSYLPWDSVDEFGRNLEAKVVAHAKENGIRNFKTAFRDLYHDEIVKRAQDHAKESVADKRHADRKNGFIGESSTPKTKFATKSIRDKSYDELGKEALKEILGH